MAAMATTHTSSTGASDDDDGFDDFLSEDEEACTLQTQEMAALARKMKTVGVREALDVGKESTLQEGFDQGFHTAAYDAFRFSVLRGSLSVAQVCGLTSGLTASETQELTSVLEQLRVRSLRVPRVALTDVASLAVDDDDGSKMMAATTTTTSEEDSTVAVAAEDEQLLATATTWLQRFNLSVPALQPPPPPQ